MLKILKAICISLPNVNQKWHDLTFHNASVTVINHISHSINRYGSSDFLEVLSFDQP
ncbi:hypothetical protein B0O79_3167 [Flavobacteriaceae bacterium MAR_2009_75]|nr:hypothetical protein B0O79_3167 [Flavobacteriaceae bacterium MAR_2009_75]